MVEIFKASYVAIKSEESKIETKQPDSIKKEGQTQFNESYENLAISNTMKVFIFITTIKKLEQWSRNCIVSPRRIRSISVCSLSNSFEVELKGKVNNYFSPIKESILLKKLSHVNLISIWSNLMTGVWKKNSASNIEKDSTLIKIDHIYYDPQYYFL